MDVLSGDFDADPIDSSPENLAAPRRQRKTTSFHADDIG